MKNYLQFQYQIYYFRAEGLQLAAPFLFQLLILVLCTNFNLLNK